MTGRGDEAILIPVKRLDQAKLRLSEKLLPEARRTLGLAMLTDVLSATSRWPARFLVTDDPYGRLVGASFGCSLVADPGAGLNRALEEGTQAAIDAGARSLLVLPSDVPLVTAADVATLFARPENVVIVSSTDGGTNALLRRPPGAVATRFGPASAEAHRRAAEEGGLECRVVTLASLTLDVDTYGDLVELGRTGLDRESARLARRMVSGYAANQPS